jgi:putative nucleotidyltransferase with HDIG domain
LIEGRESPTAELDTAAPPRAGESFNFDAPTSFESLDRELDQLTGQLARTFEELTLIHELARIQRVPEDRAASCRRALQRLAACLPVRALVSLLPPPREAADEDGPRGAEAAADLCAVTEVVSVGEDVPSEESRAVAAELVRSGTAVANHALRSTSRFDRAALVDLQDGAPGEGQLLALGRSPDPELGTVEVHLMQSVAMILHSQLEIHRQFENVRQMFEGAVRSLVSAIDAKDPYTCGHSSRVSELAASLAVDYGLSDEEVETVRMAGLLHDIGKIGVSDAVLRKPGRLTVEEFNEIKKHPELGYQILKGVPQFAALLPGVRYHHEAWDGSGYPAGLAGTEIPLIARLLAVADGFDAMTSTRPYRDGMPLSRVVEIFIGGCGTQWDPNVVSLLLENEDRMRAMCEVGHL